MTTEALYEPGTVIVLKNGKDDWNYEHAVYLGPADRGLHAVATTGTLAPFYEAPQHEVDRGGRRHPNLRWCVWSPRRVRSTTILRTLDEDRARAARLRAEREAERAAEERREEAKLDAAERIATVLDLALDGASAYARHGEIRIFGDNVTALADLVAERFGH